MNNTTLDIIKDYVEMMIATRTQALAKIEKDGIECRMDAFSLGYEMGALHELRTIQDFLSRRQ